MTQVQHVTEKEMIRRTGFNALGYTYPDKDLILLRKNLKGKKKREVIEHEVNHLKRGEEGPFLGGLAAATGIGALGGWLGGREGRKGAQAGADALMMQNAIARGDLRPYREFGYEQLGNFENWLKSPEGTFTAPTMDEVLASPGYDTRLATIENSAAAHGGLLSGNALRDIGEFGASEYDRTYARKQNEYQNELAKYMGLADVGYRAAGGSATMSNALGPSLANVYQNRGAAGANMFRDIASTVAGGIGAYQGQQRWEDFLDKAY